MAKLSRWRLEIKLNRKIARLRMKRSKKYSFYQFEMEVKSGMKTERGELKPEDYKANEDEIPVEHRKAWGDRIVALEIQQLIYDYTGNVPSEKLKFKAVEKFLYLATHLSWLRRHLATLRIHNYLNEVLSTKFSGGGFGQLFEQMLVQPTEKEPEENEKDHVQLLDKTLIENGMETVVNKAFEDSFEEQLDSIDVTNKAFEVSFEEDMETVHVVNNAFDETFEEDMETVHVVNNAFDESFEEPMDSVDVTNKAFEESYEEDVPTQKTQQVNIPNQGIVAERSQTVDYLEQSFRQGLHIIPSVERIQQRLEHMNLDFKVDQTTRYDGNCQFDGLFQQIHGREDIRNDLRMDILDKNTHHTELRQNICHFAKNSNAPVMVEMKKRYNDRYNEGSGVITESWNAYWERMSRDNEWGDENTLVASALYLQKDIIVVSTTGKAEHQVISGNRQDPDVRCPGYPLYLGYDSGMHYQSIVPKDEPFWPTDKSESIKVPEVPVAEKTTEAQQKPDSKVSMVKTFETKLAKLKKNTVKSLKKMLSLDRPKCGIEVPNYDVGYNKTYQFVRQKDKFAYVDGPRKLINGLYEHRTNLTGIVKPTVQFKRQPTYGNYLKINLKGIKDHDDLKICAQMGYPFAASEENRVQGLSRFDQGTATAVFDGYGFDDKGRYVRLAEYIMCDTASGHHIPGNSCKQANEKLYRICNREDCSQKFWVMKASIHNVDGKTISEPVRSFQITAVRRGDEREDMYVQSWNGPSLPENVKHAERFGRLPDEVQPRIEVGMTPAEVNRLTDTKPNHRAFNQSVSLPPLAEEGWKRDLLKQTEADLDHLKLGKSRQSAESAAIQIAINSTQVNFPLAIEAAVNKAPGDPSLRQLNDIIIEQNGNISDLLTGHPQTGQCFIKQADLNIGTRNPINGPFNAFLLSTDDSVQQLQSDSAITNLVRDNFLMEAINRPVRACGGCNRMPQPEVHRALPDIELTKTTLRKSPLIVADSVNAWVKKQDRDYACKNPTRDCNRPGVCNVFNKYEVQVWPRNLLLSMEKASTVSLDDFKGSVRLGNCDYTITGVVHETDDHLYKYQTSIRRGDKFTRCYQDKDGKTIAKDYPSSTQTLNKNNMKQDRKILNSKVVSLLLVRNANGEERNAPDLLTQAVTESQSVNLVQGMPRLTNPIDSNSCFLNAAVLQIAHIQGDEIVVASRRPDGEEKELTNALADIFIGGEQEPVEVTPVRNILMRSHPDVPEYAPQLPGSVSRAFKHLQHGITNELGCAKFSSEKSTGEQTDFTSLDVQLGTRQGTEINLPYEVQIESERMGLSKTPEMFVLDFNIYKQQTVEDATARVEILNDTFEPVSIAHLKGIHNWTSLCFKAPSGETSWFRVGDHSGVERLWAQRYHQQGNEQWQITGLSGNPKHALNSDVYSIVYRKVEQGPAEQSQPQDAPAEQPMEQGGEEETIDRLNQNHSHGFSQYQQEGRERRQRVAEQARALAEAEAEVEARDQLRRYQEMSACFKCKLEFSGSNEMVEHLETNRDCIKQYMELSLPVNRKRNAAYQDDTDRAIFHLAVLRKICVSSTCPVPEWIGNFPRENHYTIENLNCFNAAAEKLSYFENWPHTDIPVDADNALDVQKMRRKFNHLRTTLKAEMEEERTAADKFTNGLSTQVMAKTTNEQVAQRFGDLEPLCNDNGRMRAVRLPSGRQVMVPSVLVQNTVTQEATTGAVSLEPRQVLVPANKWAIPNTDPNAEVPDWDKRTDLRHLRRSMAETPTLAIPSEDALSLVHRDWQLKFADNRKRNYESQGNGKGRGVIEERQSKLARVTEVDPKWNETIDPALQNLAPWSMPAERESKEEMEAMSYCRGQTKTFVDMKILDGFYSYRDNLCTDLARAAGRTLVHDGKPPVSMDIGYFQNHNLVRCDTEDGPCGVDCGVDHPTTIEWCEANTAILQDEKFANTFLRHASVVNDKFEKFLLKQDYQEYFLKPVFDKDTLTVRLKGFVTHRNDDGLNRRIAENPLQVLPFDRAQEVIDRHEDEIIKTNTFPTVSVSPECLVKKYGFSMDTAEQIAKVAWTEQYSEEGKPLSLLDMWTPEDLPAPTEEENDLRQTLIYRTAPQDRFPGDDTGDMTTHKSLDVLESMCLDNQHELDRLVSPPATCRQWNKIRDSLAISNASHLDQSTIDLMEKYHYLIYKTANANEFTYAREWNEIYIRPYNPHILQLTTLAMEVEPDVTGQSYGAHWPNEQQAPGISDEIAALLPAVERHNWTTVSELEYMNTLSPLALKPLRSRNSVVINTREDKSVNFRPVKPADVERNEEIWRSKRTREEDGEVEAGEDDEYVRPDGLEKLYEQRPLGAEAMCNAQLHSQYYKPNKTMNERDTYSTHRNKCIASGNLMDKDGPFVMAGSEDMAPTAMLTTTDVLLKQRQTVSDHQNLIVRPHYHLNPRTNQHLFGTFRGAEQVDGSGSQEELEARRLRRRQLFPLGKFPA